MTTPVILTGFAAPEEEILGEFEEPKIPPRSREDLYPDFLYRFASRITPSDAGAHAAEAALDLAGISSASVDQVITCTHTPDLESPGIGGLIMRRLGMSGVPGLDLRALSAGPLLAVEHAANLIQCGHAQRILVVTVDLLTRFFPNDWLKGSAGVARGVCGDGAAAFLVMAKDGAPRSTDDLLSLELITISSGGVGVAPEVFSTEAPSSSRSPTRITADDVERKRHVPVLHVHRLFAHALHYLPPAIDGTVKESGAIGTRPGVFQFHETVAGLGGGILTTCESSFVGFHDVFSSRGFIGSAGLPLGLAVLPPEALDDGTPLVVSGLGAGPVWSVAVLRRWE